MALKLDFNPYLDTRFKPHILNTATDKCLLELRHRLDEIFGEQKDLTSLTGFTLLSRVKPHILKHRQLPGWIIKRQRTDQYAAGEEQNLCRVLTNAKIQKVLAEHQFTTVVTPKKYLYEYQGQWFVIAQEMDLLHDIKINSVPWERKVPDHLIRDLTPQQAGELAVLCYEAGLPDVGAHNLSYLQTGEVCTFDTEPVTLPVQKKWSQLPIPGIERAVEFFFAHANAQRLHDMCRNHEARLAVKKVQEEQQAALSTISSLALRALSTWVGLTEPFEYEGES